MEDEESVGLKPKYYCFYPKDFYGSRKVRVMNFIERALYREMIDLCWDSGSCPDDPQEVAEEVGVDPDLVEKSWKKVRKCFIEVDGVLTHDRVEAERDRALRKSRSGREAVEKREARKGASVIFNAPKKAEGPSGANFESLLQALTETAGDSVVIEDLRKSEYVANLLRYDEESMRVFGAYVAAGQHWITKAGDQSSLTLSRLLGAKFDSTMEQALVWDKKGRPSQRRTGMSMPSAHSGKSGDVKL